MTDKIIGYKILKFKIDTGRTERKNEDSIEKEIKSYLSKGWELYEKRLTEAFVNRNTDYAEAVLTQILIKKERKQNEKR